MFGLGLMLEGKIRVRVDVMVNVNLKYANKRNILTEKRDCARKAGFPARKR